MRCINKKQILLFVLVFMFALTGCAAAALPQPKDYEEQYMNRPLYQEGLFASELCVTDKDISLDQYTLPDNMSAAGLFDLQEQTVLYANRVHDQIYPASTTKVLTAYVTLKYGNLDDMVTVGPNATAFASDEQICGLQEGDTISLYDLLCGLILYSGNDCAVAIAEHISGSVEAFAELMNEQARELGATNTNFINPHGLHDNDHYTTAYDLYLMFNSCIKDQRFIDIISMDSYTGTLTAADGTVRAEVWEPTNYYSQGTVPQPDGITVFGGKTGTTNEAGSCVILYSQDLEASPYISVVMGADNKDALYSEMSALMSAGENK